MTANCPSCGKHSFLIPLHGEKGGPLRCPLCVGAWNAEHGRKRRLGRIVIRALRAFMDGGGKWDQIDGLKLSASGLGVNVSGYGADLAPDDDVELTSELLAEVLHLVHPDCHPSERKDAATQVTQRLLALQPFVFPAAKPKPTNVTDKSQVAEEPDKEPLRLPQLSYPCADCRSTVPLHYCDACRAEWDKREEKRRAREAAKRRAAYARHKAHRQAKPPTICAAAGCGAALKSKRRDARFCSDACRQRAHRKAAVTDKSTNGPVHLLAVTEAEAAPHPLDIPPYLRRAAP
jgi:hypothetical protein